MKKALFLITLSFIVMAWKPAAADSLWKPTADSIFIDHKAHQVGDIMTVLIVESSSAQYETKTDSSKKLDESVGAGAGLLNFIRPFSASGSRSSTGSGSATSSTNLVDRISVKVVEILPNRQMRIEGERVVNLYAEQLTVGVKGLVRPEDIGPENTVSSGRVAELSIFTKGKGSIANAHRPGLIARILQFIW